MPVPLIDINSVRKHNKEKDCWVILEGLVYDLTPLLKTHPGGMFAILDQAGRDGTNIFSGVGHSAAAKASLAKYLVGKIDPAVLPQRRFSQTRPGESATGTGPSTRTASREPTGGGAASIEGARPRPGAVTPAAPRDRQRDAADDTVPDRSTASDIRGTRRPDIKGGAADLLRQSQSDMGSIHGKKGARPTGTASAEQASLGGDSPPAQSNSTSTGPGSKRAAKPSLLMCCFGGGGAGNRVAAL